MGEFRELTRSEQRDVRKLVYGLCANYDDYYKLCAPRDKPCAMLAGACSAGKICTYFREAVLPNNPELEAALTCKPVDTKPCAICGRRFVPQGRKAYCSEKCQAAGAKTKEREKKRKQREKARPIVPI